MSLKVDKEVLRKAYRQKRRAFVEKCKINSSVQGLPQELSIHKRVIKQLSGVLTALGTDGSVWGSYLGHLNSELNLGLLSPSDFDGKLIRWAYPVVEGQRLRFFIPQDGEKSLRVGALGILEPNPESSKEVFLQDLEGVLVPGLAFDSHGGRLGQGKGFYDRFLKNFKGVKAGIAYSVQVSQDFLPVSESDIPMDVLITEDGVISPSHRVPLGA